VDLPRYGVPDHAAIDNLFAFAKTADVKVIYSFRLLNGNKTNAAELAGYIWHRYPQRLAAFSIGNEPDWMAYHNQDPNIADYPTYLADWNNFAAAIAASAPGARLAGPDTGSNYPAPGAQDTRFDGESWTQRFADDEKRLGFTPIILQHDYVGQSAKGVTIPTAVDAMLSPGWVNFNYPTLYQGVLARIVADGLSYRLTECNDCTGGVNGASNAFASALWALDYLHWWAAHGCAGVNFHNKRWIYTDTIYLDSAGNCRVNPKAYGLKAFALGSHGRVITAIKATNPDGINLNCYAVGDANNLYVTIINKTHDSASAGAAVLIKPEHFIARNGEYILLESAPASDPAAAAAKLGGATFTRSGSWHGVWTPLDLEADGQCALTVKSASAAVIHFR